ncbi:hypothetical protein RI367_003808 [Sorochytrium milnesiophthora]
MTILDAHPIVSPANERDSLRNHTVLDLVQSKGGIVDIAVDATVFDAMQTLRAKGIVSLPVYGHSGHWVTSAASNTSSGDKQYLGILSMLDICTWLLQQQQQQQRSGMTDAQLEELVRATPVRSLLGESLESRSLWVTSASNDLMALMEPLAKGIHRWLVEVPATQTGSVFRVCTQTDIVRYIHANLPSLPALNILAYQTVEQLGLVTPFHPALAVTAGTPLLQCITYMTDNGYTALAVVDDATSRRLVGTFSLSDLRAWEIGKYSLLAPSMTIAEYLQLEKHQFPAPTVDPVADENEQKPGLIVCQPHDTLMVVLERVVLARVHRAWVVDSHTRPIGVVTLTDIIRCFFNAALQEEQL